MIFRTRENTNNVSQREIFDIFGVTDIIRSKLGKDIPNKGLDLSKLTDNLKTDNEKLKDYLKAVNDSKSKQKEIDRLYNEMLNGSSTLQNFAYDNNLKGLKRDDVKDNAAIRSKLNEFGIASRVAGVKSLATDNSFTNMRQIINVFNHELDKTGLTQKQFAEGVKGGNTELGNYLSTVDKGEASFGGYIRYLTKAKLASVGMQMATMVLSMAMQAVATLIVTKVVSAIDNFVHAQEKAAEKAEESRSAYEGTVSELEALEQQLAEVEKKLNEINALDGISTVDDSETTKLKLENELLSTQLEIKKKLAKYRQSQAADDANNALTAKNPHLEVSSVFTNSARIVRSDIIDDTTRFANSLEEEKLKKLRLLEEQSGLDVDTQRYKQIEVELKDIEAFISKYEKEISEGLSTINENYDSLFTADGELIDEGHSETVKRVKELLDLLSEADAKTTKDNIRSKTSDEIGDNLDVLTDKQLEIANDIVEKAIAGNLEVPQDVLSSWDALKSKIDSISADNVENSFTKAVSKVESLSTGLDQLAEIYNDVKDGGDFDYSKMLNNEDFTKSFGSLDSVYDEFIKTVTNSPKNIKACQTAFNTLTEAYINQKSALSGVTEETKAAITQELRQMGITNAAEIVEQRLTVAKLVGKDASWQKVAAMYSEAEAGSEAQRLLGGLLATEIDLNNVQINTASDVEQLINLANAAGASAEFVARLQDLLALMSGVESAYSNTNRNTGDDRKGGNSPNKVYKSQLASLKESISSALKDGALKKLNAEDFKTPTYYPKKKKTDGSDDNKPIDKFKKYVSGLFDWIEIRLNRLQDKTEKYLNRAEQHLEKGNYISAKRDYNTAASYTANQIAASQTASDKYKNASDSILNKAVKQGVISERQAKSIKEKMKNGTLDISKYSDDVKSVIDEYQTYYEKSLEQDKNLDGLKEKYKEYIEKLYSIPAEKASAAIKELEDEQSDLEAKMANLDSAKDKNAILDDITTNADKQLDAYKTEQRETEADINDAWSNKTNKGIKAAKNTSANKGKKKGEKLSTKGLKEGSDAYNAVIKYNAAIDANKKAIENVSDATEEYTNTVRENAKTKFDNISEEYDSKQSEFESNIANSQALMQLIEKTGKDGQSSTIADLYSDIIKQNNDLISSKQAELTELEKSFAENKADMSEADRQAALSTIASVETEIVSLRGEIEDANAAIAELPFLELEKQLELLDSIGGKLSSDAALKEAKGLDLSISDYQKQIDSNIDKIENKTKTANEAYSNYLKAIASGGAYGGKSSDEWLKEYNNAQTEINNIKVENEQLKDSLRDDVYWRTFERAHDAAKRFSDTLSGISELISDDMLFDSEGNLTEFGFSKLALDIKGIETAREEVNNYIKDIDNLNKLYAAKDHSGYSPEEYTEELARLHTELLNSAASVKSYTDSVVNMYKDIAKAELDSLFELIDARNEALNAKKAYYDYDKTISSKTKDIQSLQAQIAALEGVNGSEAKAKRAKLSAELEEAQEDLNDTIMEHKFELSQDALSEMKDLLQEEFDDKFKDLSSNLTEIQNVINSASGIVSSSITDVNDTIKTLLGHYGLSEEAISNLSNQEAKEDVFVNPAQHMATTTSNLMSAFLGALGITTGYASGTKYVPRKMTAWTQENGAEIIVTKHGMITPLDRGDGVVPAELTRRLYDMALGNYNVLPGVLPNHTGVPDISTSFAPNITQHYDNLINIEGSADAATVADLKKLSSDLMKKSYEYMSKKTFEDFIRSGGKRKI